MRYKRYGKFRFSDYSVSWLMMVVLLVFIIVDTTFQLTVWITLVSSLYILLRLASILKPNFEYFRLYDDYIVTFLGKKKHSKIIIPKELTLIVSYTDIAPPFAVRTVIGNETHILKGKYSISILKKMSSDFVVDSIHYNRVQKYTTSMISQIFNESCFVYSFVFDQSLFEKITKNRDYMLIVPQSVLNSIPFEFESEHIYIDYNG